MSSDEREDDDADRNAELSKDQKGKKVQRACDACRRKKVRCDGSKVPHIRCTNCVLYNYDCTYVENANKRSPPKSYVESLEKRVAKLQQLLGKIAPEALNQLDKTSNTKMGPPDRRLPPSNNPVPLSAISNNPSSDPARDIEFDDVMRLQDLSTGRGTRFFGKYSGVMLHQATLQLKHDYITGNPGSFIPDFPPMLMHTPDPPRDLPHSFPEKDLMQSLIELYFAHQNILFPLLHRPTFEKYVAGGLHLFNNPFAEKLLLVCAIGTRYSDDPRVLLDDKFVLSRGWKWFSQVQVSRDLLIKIPTTDGMQFCCLVAMYLLATSFPQASWRYTGLGLRIAQDMGAHRRRAHNSVPTVEDELMKRAFWTLLLLNRLLSLPFGRPCAIQDEDYDVDLPIECDDEYWDHPDPQKRFKQPINKPSVLTYFIYHIKLCKILAFLLRTIYADDKSKILLGFAGQEWEKSVVGELDTALNEFIDSIPIHLKWDPDKEDRIFFEQSGALYSTMYHLQMLVHRPFILQPDKRTTLCLPPFSLCINAARSCSRIAGVQARRSVMIDFTFQTSIFFGGIILLISIWGGKRLGLTTDPQKDLECVHKCMDVLKATEIRWGSGGRLWDILSDLASVEQVPLPGSVSSTNKRERDEDEPESLLASAPVPSTTAIDPPTAQPLGMPQNVVMPGRSSWDNTGGATRAGSVTLVSSLQHPQIQQHMQSRPPLRRSKSQASHLQAPQQTERLPPAHRLYSINTELDRQPLHHQSTSFNQQQMNSYSTDAQHWSRPFTDDPGGGDIQSSVRSTTADPQVYSQTRSTLPFQIIDDNNVPHDAMRIEHSSEAYTTYSSSVDNAQYYASIHPQASTSAVADGAPQYLATFPHYTRQSQVQQQPNLFENDAYGLWSWAMTGLRWDGWAQQSYMSNISPVTDDPDVSLQARER